MAGCPDFSSYQHNEKISSWPSRLIYFLQSRQDTSPVIIRGDKVTLKKVIQMADVRTVSFLRLEMPASVLLNVSGT